MNDNKYILINGRKTNVIVTPYDLEMNNVMTQHPKGSQPKVNTFIHNPLKLVHYLCRAYSIKFKSSTGKYLESDKLMRFFRIKIIAMEIDVRGVGPLVRKAKRNAIFKLHKAYTKKCI